MLTTLKALAIIAGCVLWTFLACDAHASDCRPDELVQARADIESGAHLLASPDPVTSLLGYQLMQSAFARESAARVLCQPTERSQRWADDEFGPSLPDGIDRDEAAAVLGVEPEAAVTALVAAGMVADPSDPFENTGGAK